MGAGSDVEALTDLPSAVDESALDRTANPCDDFYQFTCGGYLNSVTLSSDYDIHSRTFGGENTANREALTELLAAAARSRTSKSSRRSSSARRATRWWPSPLAGSGSAAALRRPRSGRATLPSPTPMPTFVTDIARERELDGTETSNERFDRMAFAERAVALVKPANMRVAIAEGRSRVVVESGRAWGRPDGARWAMLCVPPSASRRAIAAAVATLAGPAPRAYVIDTLLADGVDLGA